MIAMAVEALGQHKDRSQPDSKKLTKKVRHFCPTVNTDLITKPGRMAYL